MVSWGRRAVLLLIPIFDMANWICKKLKKWDSQSILGYMFAYNHIIIALLSRLLNKSIRGIFYDANKILGDIFWLLGIYFDPEEALRNKNCRKNTTSIHYLADDMCHVFTRRVGESCNIINCWIIMLTIDLPKKRYNSIQCIYNQAGSIYRLNILFLIPMALGSTLDQLLDSRRSLVHNSFPGITYTLLSSIVISLY